MWHIAHCVEEAGLWKVHLGQAHSFCPGRALSLLSPPRRGLPLALPAASGAVLRGLSCLCIVVSRGLEECAPGRGCSHAVHSSTASRLRMVHLRTGNVRESK